MKTKPFGDQFSQDVLSKIQLFVVHMQHCLILKISPQSVQKFWSYLVHKRSINRQTNKQTQLHYLRVVVGKGLIAYQGSFRKWLLTV